MFAEVKDVDELLEMIKNSTELKDYIRFDLNGDDDTNDTYNGQPETQPLILMNPAGFFLKYLMPKELPTNISLNQTAELSKGYYHGLAFDIPGAETSVEVTKVGGKKINLKKNFKVYVVAVKKDGSNVQELANTITGHIIAVDDQWNGLSLSQDFNITVSKEDTGIRVLDANSSATEQINLGGLRIGKGYKGIVISNGRKNVTK